MKTTSLYQLACIVACLTLHVEGGVSNRNAVKLQSPLSVLSFQDISGPENEETAPKPSDPSTTTQQTLSSRFVSNNRATQQENGFHVTEEGTYKCHEMNSSRNRLNPHSLMTYSQLVNASSFQETQEDIQMRKVEYVAITEPARNQRGGQGLFYFEVEKERHSTVTMSHLWIYIRPVKTKRTRKVALTLALYPSISVLDARYVEHVVTLSKHANVGFWEKIPLNDVMNEFLVSSQQKFRISISSTEFPDLIATGENPNEKSLKPRLEVTDFISSSKSRKNPCKLHDYRLDFHEIGWNWIIFPRAFNAKYCAGQCFPPAVNSILSRHDGEETLEGPCCRPSGYAPLSLLYYDKEGSVVYSEMPDMVVTGCECTY